MRAAGRRIFGQFYQKGGGRRGSRREVAGAIDGAPAAAWVRRRRAGCRRRSRRGDLPRASRRDATSLGCTGMIAKLAGVVEQIEPDAAVIDVGGVGYLAFCSTRTIGRLPPLVSPVDSGQGRRRKTAPLPPLRRPAGEPGIGVLGQEQAGLGASRGGRAAA